MSSKKIRKMNFDMLLEHVGHNLECVTYGADGESNETVTYGEDGQVSDVTYGDIYNVAIECVECNVVLYDIDNPEFISD